MKAQVINLVKNRRFSWAQAIFFLVLNLIVGYLKPGYGIELSMAGAVVVLGLIVMAFVVAVFVDFFDQKLGVNIKEVTSKLLPLGVVFGLVVTLVTPISQWIMGLLPL